MFSILIFVFCTQDNVTPEILWKLISDFEGEDQKFLFSRNLFFHVDKISFLVDVNPDVTFQNRLSKLE
tara:strand:- start:524 stop:727 length:204 start_codon:yes stop_codon:yes gene_type:complete